LRAIKEYIARDNPAAARRFCLELYDATGRLKLFPRSGQVAPEFGLEDLREILYGGYRILYECRPGACYVKAVIHGSRDLQRHIDPSNWT
jgi:plasmid stabilization system protein ParE